MTDEVKKIVIHDMNRFSFKRVLNNDPHTKLIFVEGKFESDDDPAVVIIEKTPFSESQVNKILKVSNEEDCQETFQNDIYSGFRIQPDKTLNEIKATVIHPATPKHIEKYSKQETHLVVETPELYKLKVEPYIRANQFSVQWVYNILDHKKEQESVLLEDEDKHIGFMLCKDMKWDMKLNTDLHCLAIVHDRSLTSIRDLRAKHLPLLKNLKQKTSDYLKDKHGLAENQVMMYFHYQPSYYHLHLHIVALTFEYPPGGSCNRGHLLDTVISNIELIDDYYEKATLCYTLKMNEPLTKVISATDGDQAEQK